MIASFIFAILPYFHRCSRQICLRTFRQISGIAACSLFLKTFCSSISVFHSRYFGQLLWQCGSRSRQSLQGAVCLIHSQPPSGSFPSGRTGKAPGPCSCISGRPSRQPQWLSHAIWLIPISSPGSFRPCHPPALPPLMSAIIRFIQYSCSPE